VAVLTALSVSTRNITAFVIADATVATVGTTTGARIRGYYLSRLAHRERPAELPRGAQRHHRVVRPPERSSTWSGF
jgi:hypothetical protein